VPKPIAIAIQQHDLVASVGGNHRVHQLARVNLDAAVVLIEMPQHDSQAHN
jgi:hypothetical protein